MSRRKSAVAIAFAAVLVGAVLRATAPALTPFAGGSAVFPLLDSIEVLVREREILAIDARGGAVVRARLELNESVLYADARGRVAIVVTGRRVLAATTGGARWHATELGVHESLPIAVYIGDRVALVVTDRRLIGVSSSARYRVFAEPIGLREALLDIRVGENVAVVLTDRRVLGQSAFQSGFSEERVSLHERIDSIATLADFATVATHRRLLVFDAPTGVWEERTLSLR